MYREERTGLWCRENTLDEYVIKEQSCYNKMLEHGFGKTVMDIGGNIGAFAFHALEYGAEKVVSFEPEPDNIRIFKKQELPNVKLIEKAISSEDGIALLYMNKGKNKGMHSLQDISGRDCIQVKTWSFEKALRKFEPELLKIDIEGAEFGIPLNRIPSFVEGIAIEIHLNHKGNREAAAQLIHDLRKQFPHVLRQPNITDKNWTTLFIGFR